MCAKFYIKTQNPTKITVESQRFRILKIQDGGWICNKTLRTQILQSIAGPGAYNLDHRAIQ